MRYPLGPHPTDASANDPAEPALAADTGVETPDPTPLDTKIVDDPAADDLIVTTTAGLVGFVGFTVLGVSGLQVGQELGVDAGPAEDGVDDLLPRGPFGDAEGGAGPDLLGVVVYGHCAILYST